MHDQTTEKASDIGREHGANAANWVEIQSAHDARVILGGIEDCDPIIMDAYRVPDLSGEFADDYNEIALRHDLGLCQVACNHCHDAMDEATSAYEDAAYAAFWDTLETCCRAILGQVTA